MTTENQNAEQPRMVRVKCLKNFNLEGLPGMFLAGTEQGITEQQVEFLQKMGLTSQPFIEIIDPGYNKPAPKATPATPQTWTQTHGNGGIGAPVMAGLNPPAGAPAPAPVESPKEPEPVKKTPTKAVPEASGEEEPSPKESVKPKLSLKKK